MTSYKLKILICCVSFLFNCSYVSTKKFDDHVKNSKTEISLLKSEIENIVNENHNLNELLSEYEDLVLQQKIQSDEINRIKIELEKMLLNYDQVNSKLDSTNYKMLVELTTILQSRINEVSK